MIGYFNQTTPCSAINRDDFDEAGKSLSGSLVPLLEKIRDWISTSVK